MQNPIALLLLFAATFPVTGQTTWQLVWSDEFDGPANSGPDPAKWKYDLGATGWGNAELQNYTNSLENAHLDGRGNLVIRALRTAAGGYTSARLKTQGKYSVVYGKVEARIKIPYGQGIWPAFWMLGDDVNKVGWPKCGEIDIMENIGREPDIVHGTLHAPGYSGAKALSAAYPLPSGRAFSDDFHTFAIIWTSESIEFLVDSISYYKVTPATIPAGTKWIFNKPFFLLLDLAVGGKWPGKPDTTTQFPQELTVDYVRKYSQ